MSRSEQPTVSVFEHARPRTLCEAFQASVERVPTRIALRTLADAMSLTWADYATAVKEVAGSLSALGVDREDRVAFISGNRPELAICEVAALHLGAAGVAVYPASPPATIEHILDDSEPAVLLVESSLCSRLADVDHRIARVLTLDGERAEHQPIASIAAQKDFDFDAAWRSVQPADLAALIYTSGTTGRPKAVEWTHQAATDSVHSFDSAGGEPDRIHDLSYAPFASLAERYGGHWHALTRGSTRTICPDPAQLPAALLDARPTRLGGPPQVWQRLRRALEASLDEHEREVLAAASERVRRLARGHRPAALDAAQQATLATLRARVGLDRVTLAASTAAPCPLPVHEHFAALDVPFREFFATTETGVVAAQRAGGGDFGTLGPAIPGYRLELDADGEVLVRSPCAPRSYRNRPRETAETYAADGWIHTGDTGSIDEQGRLRLVGRKKELIALENGRKVAPARVEAALEEACPDIARVFVYGEERPHLVALVVIDPPGGHDESDTREAVAAAVARVNRSLDPRERIQAHAILPGPWLPGAELTETLKPRRSHIAERHAATIAALYADT